MPANHLFSLKNQLTHFGLNPQEWTLVFKREQKIHRKCQQLIITQLVNTKDKELKLEGIAIQRQQAGTAELFWKSLSLNF